MAGVGLQRFVIFLIVFTEIIMSTASSSSSGGIGVLGLLGVVFVALKLIGIISWSWWYVTMPFWGGLALVAAIGTIALIVWGGLSLVEYAGKKIRKRQER